MASKKTDVSGGGQKTGAASGGGGQTAGGRKGAGAGAGAGGAAGQPAPGVKTVASRKAADSGSAGAQKAGSPRKGAAKEAGSEGGSSGVSGRRRSAAGAAGGGDLRGDARAFAAARPHGWNHDEWLGFLDDLRQKGHNIEDRETVGNLLERERLSIALERVPGIGPQRVRSIAERYGNLWRLKDVGAEELARDANIPRPLAERIVDSIR